MKFHPGIDKNLVCRYRNEGNKRVDRCAIGICIPKEMYSHRMEGYGVLTMFNNFPELRELFDVDGAVISRIQNAHDLSASIYGGKASEKFRTCLGLRLKKVCLEFGLTFPGD